MKVAANSAVRLSSGRISTFLSWTRQNASSFVQTGSRRQWTAFSAAILQWALNRGSSSPWHKFKYRRLVIHVFKPTNNVGLTGWKTLWMSSNSLARQRKPTKYSLPYTSRWLAYVFGTRLGFCTHFGCSNLGFHSVIDRTIITEQKAVVPCASWIVTAPELARCCLSAKFKPDGYVRGYSYKFFTVQKLAIVTYWR